MYADLTSSALGLGVTQSIPSPPPEPSPVEAPRAAVAPAQEASPVQPAPQPAPLGPDQGVHVDISA